MGTRAALEVAQRPGARAAFVEAAVPEALERCDDLARMIRNVLDVSRAAERDGYGFASEVPAELQPLVFQPQGAAALRESGRRVDSGLGLVSCRVAAEAMGAELSLSSDQERGTEVVLTLPVRSERGS